MCPGGYPIQETQNWQSAFLPGVYQGTYIDTRHTDIEKLIENIRNNYVAPTEQRQQLDLLRQLNERHLERRQQDAQLEARIQSFELAYRMQTDADRRLRRQPGAAARPRAVRPRRARPAAADRPPAARARRALRAGLARRTASRGTATTTSRSTIAGWPRSATRPSAPC